MTETIQLSPTFYESLGIHVVEHKEKCWGFCGVIPVELAFRYDDIQDAVNAAKFGMGLVQRTIKQHGRSISKRTFESREQAIRHAERYGIEVSNK